MKPTQVWIFLDKKMQPETIKIWRNNSITIFPVSNVSEQQIRRKMTGLYGRCEFRTVWVVNDEK